MKPVKLLLTSDLHQYIQKWEDIVEEAIIFQPDYLLIAGDLLPKQEFPYQRSFFSPLRRRLEKIKKLTPAKVLTYFGNDDAHVLEPMLDELAADDLCINLNQKVWKSEHFIFCGMPMVRDYPFGYKHWCVPDGKYITCPVQFCGEGLEMDQQGKYINIPNLEKYLKAKQSIEARLNTLKQQAAALGSLSRSIWLVHQPPAHCGMDICGTGEQVGSPTVTQFIKDTQPLLGISGHIHESPYQEGGQWHKQIGKTHWFQPGQISTKLHSVRVSLIDNSVNEFQHSVMALNSNV